MIRINTFMLISLLLTALSCDKTVESTVAVTEDGIVQNPERGLWQDENTAPVQSELISEIRIKSDTVMIGSIDDPVMDAQGNFYFMDRTQNSIISADQKGDIRWRSGKEGRGPGDLSNAFGMTIHQKKLYVANIMGSRLDEYDLSGSFIRSFQMPEEIRFGSLMGMNNRNEFVLSTMVQNSSGANIKLMSLQKDSLVLNGEISIIETDNENSSSMGSVVINNDQYWYTYINSYSLRAYDRKGLTGGMDREFSRPMGRIDGGERGITVLGYIYDPMILNDGNYLIRAVYPLDIDSKESFASKFRAGNAPDYTSEESISLFNKDHEFLYEITDQDLVEDSYEFSYRGPDGYYYEFQAEPIPLIRKFRVTVNESN